MFLLDVNVVLAAHRDDHPRHVPARRWFDEMLAGDEAFTVPLPVWGSFLRLATNRRIFGVPTPVEAAFEFIDATCAQPGYLAVAPGARHLHLLRQLCDEGDAAGDLIADAVVAATAAEHGCRIVTLDRDFARFTSVHHLLLGGSSRARS